MNKLNNNIKNVCNYLQRMDRNGDYIDMYEEYIQGDVPLEIILEVCNRVLNEWIEDLQTIPNPTKDDKKDITIMQSYIDLLK